MVHLILDRRSFVFLAALLAMSAAPLAAQEGRDLLVPVGTETPVRVGAVHRGLIERAADVPVSVRARDVRSIRRDAVGVAQPATEIYRYDDNDLEAALYLVDDTTDEPLFEFELAQRFRLPSAGTVEYTVVCMGRGMSDTSADVEFALNFYSGAGSTPGPLLADYVVTAQLRTPGTYFCFPLGDDLQGLSLDAGNVWVAVSWQRAAPPENTKFLMADQNGPGGGKGGIWASGESGLLWFFSRGNAEVLVKVLNGCSYNGHRWVFVAPVTDVAFNLYVTDGEGDPWSHRNRQGETATPKRDTSAFPCRE